MSTILRLEEVASGGTSYVLGYPTSITLKVPNALDPIRPLVRRGLIADVDLQRRHIVLDCAVYKGNSGGPVFVLDERQIRVPPDILAIGIVSRFVPFAEEWQNVEFGFKYVTTSNSGYAIVEPMDPIIELMDQMANP